MSTRRRLKPLPRGAEKRSAGWNHVREPHPGVRDPRSMRAGNWPQPVNAAIVATCAFITALAILNASLASPIGKVDEWHEWRAESGIVRLEHPAGWAVHEIGSSEQVYLVIVRSPWVRIHVISESSIADMYRQIGDGDERYRALQMVHESTADTWATQLFSELEEGRISRTSIGGQHAMWSQFKYAGRYFEQGEPMSGYRATIIGTNCVVIASTVAPEEHWEEFKPIALHVLKSIRLGGQTD